MHDRQFTWFPESLSDFWGRRFGENGDTIGEALSNNWIELLKSNLFDHYGFSSTREIPCEYTAVHIYPDQESISGLWVLMGPLHDGYVDLGTLRGLLSILADIHGTCISSHSDRVHSLLKVMNVDRETRLLSRSVFISRFPIWFSTWSWWSFKTDPLEETLAAWNHVDVSNCGVLSRASMNGTLLPYVSRLWYPSSPDDSVLMDKWIVAMMSFLSGTKAQWVAHWQKFQGVNGLNFVKPSDRSLKELTLSALAYFNITEEEEYFIAESADFVSVAPNPKFKSRAFALWLFSLDITKEESLLIPNVARIETFTEFNEICMCVWKEYFGLNTKHFDSWLAKLLPPKFPVLRSYLADRLLTHSEIDRLWETVSDDSQYVLVENLHCVLKSIYKDEGGVKGQWIVDQWMSEIITLCPSKPLIDEPSFRSAFPMWFATLERKGIPTNEDPRIAAVWPVEMADRNVFSKPVLEQLLTAVWNKYAPSNIPCQQWWVDRCCHRLETKGTVSREDFCAIFPTIREINTILYMCRNFGSTTIADLLFHTANPSNSKNPLPDDFVQEFFLIANLKPIEEENPIDIPREIFTYAFPLWCAAHYVH